MSINKLFLGTFVLIAALSSCDFRAKNKKENASGQASPEVFQDTVTMNGHVYRYDVVSGATKETKSTNPEPMNYEEKLKKMFWSGKPALGFIHGDYYHTDTTFSGGYIAQIDVVKQGDRLVLVEFDEVAPVDYYAPEWAGLPKRLSGYGFFQAQSQRTENTMVTLINGLTYLEYQMLTENRLTGNFNTVKGSSNSVRRAFMPATATLAKQTDKPSGAIFYGLAKELDGGLIGRLRVIKKEGKIAAFSYDEIFEDQPELIADPALRQFYRQSKYQSVQYTRVTGSDFKAFSNALGAGVIQSQDLLKLEPSVLNQPQFAQELANYRSLATELQQQIRTLSQSERGTSK